MVPIVVAMTMIRLEWFGHVNKRAERETIRAVGELKMNPRGRQKLRWDDTARGDLNAWTIREEWATARERWNGLCNTRYPTQGEGGER